MCNLNIKGIDISNYQGDLDLKVVKKSGVDVVIIEAGDGITFTNPYLKQQYTNAKEAGLKVGFYHFFRAEDDAEVQAQAFWNRIKNKNFEIYPILDVEVTMGVANVTDSVINFINAFKKISKKDLILYSYVGFINTNFDKRLENFRAWIASYGVDSLEPTIFKNVVGWQYADNIKIGALNNSLDGDRFSTEIFMSNGYSPIIEQEQAQIKKTPLWAKCVHGQIIKNLQYELDIQFKDDLVVDGWFGELTLGACIDIAEGAQGPITEIMQQRLIAKGFSCGSCGVDGDFGPETLQSLENFQAANHLVVDGICGKNTWKSLMFL